MNRFVGWTIGTVLSYFAAFNVAQFVCFFLITLILVQHIWRVSDLMAGQERLYKEIRKGE